jgi:TonB family protein
MKISSVIITFICIITFFSCTADKNITKFEKKPELIHRVPLTSYIGKFSDSKFELKTRLLISEEGNVEEVELLNSSGDKEWDQMAIKKIKEWKYSPAIYHEKPVTIWLLQSIKITVLESFQMHLAEITFKSLSVADTIYSKLKEGIEFSVLARQYSISESSKKSGDLGVIDIRNYSESVQEILVELKNDEVSKPIKIDNLYHIFKRLRFLTR